MCAKSNFKRESLPMPRDTVCGLIHLLHIVICKEMFLISALPVTDDNGDSAVIVIRTTTLMTLLVISLIGNALVVLSVAQARSTRYVPFNAFVLSMASYCLLECALTMSLATG